MDIPGLSALSPVALPELKLCQAAQWALDERVPVKLNSVLLWPRAAQLDTASILPTAMAIP